MAQHLSRLWSGPEGAGELGSGEVSLCMMMPAQGSSDKYGADDPGELRRGQAHQA